MRARCTKFEQANVVAGFDSQDNAEEAVLLLRGMGLKDRQIGYFYPIGNGQMADLLVQYHRLAATVIGGIFGIALGGGLGYLLATWNYPPGESPDMVGLVATCAMCGAFFLGTAGGMNGLWTVSPGPVAPAPVDTPPPFVLAVAAGGAAEQVRTMMRQHGGYELRSQTSDVTISDGRIPAPHAI